jgi:hypothetical protein
MICGQDGGPIMFSSDIGPQKPDIRKTAFAAQVIDMPTAGFANFAMAPHPAFKASGSQSAANVGIITVGKSGRAQLPNGNTSGLVKMQD